MKWLIFTVILNWGQVQTEEMQTKEIYITSKQVVTIHGSDRKTLKDGKSWVQSCKVEVLQGLDVATYRIYDSCQDVVRELNGN